MCAAARNLGVAASVAYVFTGEKSVQAAVRPLETKLLYSHHSVNNDHSCIGEPRPRGGMEHECILDAPLGEVRRNLKLTKLGAEHVGEVSAQDSYRDPVLCRNRMHQRKQMSVERLPDEHVEDFLAGEFASKSRSAARPQAQDGA